MPFKIVRNDITKMQVDAIVNTANEAPIYSTGVDTAVYKAAGEEALLAERKKIGYMEEGEAIVSTVLFDNRTEVLHDRVDIKRIKPMTENEYYVRGCTALLDAVGGAIHHIGNVHKYAREEDRPEKTLFIITTDGMENASQRYTYDQVKRMVERQKEKHGWEFLFLGANIDAIAVASRFGIQPERAVKFECDSAGTAVNYRVLSQTVSRVRQCAQDEMEEALCPSWKEEIEADYKARHKGN